MNSIFLSNADDQNEQQPQKDKGHTLIDLSFIISFHLSCSSLPGLAGRLCVLQHQSAEQRGDWLEGNGQRGSTSLFFLHKEGCVGRGPPPWAQSDRWEPTCSPNYNTSQCCESIVHNIRSHPQLGLIYTAGNLFQRVKKAHQNHFSAEQKIHVWL